MRQPLTNKISALKTQLYNLLVEEKRRKYFEAAYSLRAEGKGTGALVKKGMEKRNYMKDAHHISIQVGRMLRCSPRQAGCQFLFSKALICVINNTPLRPILPPDLWRKVSIKVEDNGASTLAVTVPDGAQGGIPRESNVPNVSSCPAFSEVRDDRFSCLLCAERARLSSRWNLNRHTAQVHTIKGIFEASFPCPECSRLGRQPFQVSGLGAWCNHVEATHGCATPSGGLKRKRGPTLRDGPGQKAQAPNQRNRTCFLYPEHPNFGPGPTALSDHMYAQHQAFFSAPSLCPECVGQGLESPYQVTGMRGFAMHVWRKHPIKDNLG